MTLSMTGNRHNTIQLFQITEVMKMIKIIVSILLLVLSLFLTFLFWDFSEDSDNRIVSSLLDALTIVFLLCAGVSALICIWAVFTIRGA